MIVPKQRPTRSRSPHPGDRLTGPPGRRRRTGGSIARTAIGSLRPCRAPATPSAARRGVVVPLVALILLVLGMIIALVFDRLWLAAARRELQSAADAAALAAAGVLLDDTFLAQRMHDGRTAPPPADRKPLPFGPARNAPATTTSPAVKVSEALLQRARREAARVAGLNAVAGAPVRLDTARNGDVRFGRLVRRPNGDMLFLQTAFDPTTVVVTAHRTRSRSNPVALLFQGIAGPAADLRARAEASFTSWLMQLAPAAGLRVPAAPIAVPWSRNNGFAAGWRESIEMGEGEDRWSYDPEAHRVTPGSDGLPELRVRCAIRPDENDVQWLVLDFANDLSATRLVAQWRYGLDEADLTDWDGRIDLTRWPKQLRAMPACPIDLANVLAGALGERRIVFVFDRFTPTGRAGTGRATLAGIVGARLMAVETRPDSSLEITLQPAFVTTRAAEAVPDWFAETSTPEIAPQTNRYVYKLMLTH
ncbi:MAG: hypothetical protein D6725_16930 [Planctomycetota bacterium]|nr:MAG: hypothetical protein D6725_16930 [Planctomycetota bacterium]